MEKTINRKMMLLVPVFMLLFLVSFASAKQTVVAGKVYNEDFSATVPGASVSVECNQTTKTDTTTLVGTYAVQFNSSECGVGNLVTVTATKGDLSGVQTGTVDDYGLTVNFSVVNVPIVPEFGVIVGTLTLVGAVGLFFFVRRH